MRMTKWSVPTLAGLLVSLSIPPTALGVSFRLGEERLVALSTAVVIGTVVSSKSRWREDPGIPRIIVTLHQLELEKVIAGDVTSLAGFSGSSIEVETFGGLVGDTAIYVEEAAALAEGHRYLLFLYDHDENHTTYVTGRLQGEFQLTRQDGEDMAQPMVDAELLSFFADPGEEVSTNPQPLWRVLQRITSVWDRVRGTTDIGLRTNRVRFR